MSLRHTTTAINPITGNGEKYLEIEIRCLQNTFEQFVVNAFGQLVLATFLEDSLQKLIPVLVLYFVVARALFYFGYRRDPLKRALGMSMSHAPNLGVYLYIVYCLICYGPLHGLNP
jgi:uncharacterized membrane protein YecN with MAPEG domain